MIPQPDQVTNIALLQALLNKRGDSSLVQTSTENRITSESITRPNIAVSRIRGNEPDPETLLRAAQIREAYKKWGVEGSFLDHYDTSGDCLIYLAHRVYQEYPDLIDYEATMRITPADLHRTGQQDTEALNIMRDKSTGLPIDVSLGIPAYQIGEIQRLAIRPENESNMNSSMFPLLVAMLREACVDAESFGLEYFIAMGKPYFVEILKRGGIKFSMVSDVLGLDRSQISIDRSLSLSQDLIDNYFAYFLDSGALATFLKNKGFSGVTPRNLSHYKEAYSEHRDEIMETIPDGPLLMMTEVASFKRNIDHIYNKLFNIIPQLTTPHV